MHWLSIPYGHAADTLEDMPHSCMLQQPQRLKRTRCWLAAARPEVVSCPVGVKGSSSLHKVRGSGKRQKQDQQRRTGVSAPHGAKTGSSPGPVRNDKNLGATAAEVKVTADAKAG